ncbi:hypothetical protein KYY02_01670 [Streptomyces pimonensis]|uniref:Uncharacterized protein n=1 Tax=Streptomyces pimonensis TaxID=2860288 RepID=A0ABV4IS49_9ACTN
MFAAIFDGHYGFLAVLAFVGLAMGGLAWWTATRKGSPHGLWWSALTATVTGVLGFPPASASCCGSTRTRSRTTTGCTRYRGEGLITPYRHPLTGP